MITKLKRTGFTIVEMMVVVAVLGILISLTAFATRGWQQSIDQRQVRSDLAMAATAMESTKNFSEGYPSGLPASVKPSNGVTITYIGGNATNYCLQAMSVKDATVVYSVDSAIAKEPRSGSCGAAYALSAPSPSISGVTGTSMVVSWAPVGSATAYSVKYGTATPTTTAACSASPCTLTGLSNGTNYKVNVSATSAYSSATSATINATTSIPAPSAPAATYVVTKNGTTSQTYTVTATGGTCSIGSTEWKFTYTTDGSDPDWGTASWTSANTASFNQITNGIVAPSPYTLYAKPRCVSGAASTEYSSYAIATLAGR